MRVVTRNSYDSAGRLSSVNYYDATGAAVETVTTTYDADSKVTGVSMAGTGYSSSATYDVLDRPTASSQSGPAGTLSTTATYDVADLVTASTWSAFGLSRSTETTYAKTGEMKKMTVHDGSTSAPTTTDWYFAFDVAGNMTRAASGLSSHLVTYDAAGRLSALRLGRADGVDAVADWATQRLEYDGWERLASSSIDYETGTDASETFSYDAAGRIETWSRTGFGQGSASYTFDAAGNLTAKTVGTTTTAYSYNAGNQLTTETVGASVTTHSYDEFGRLTHSSAPAEETTYTYDALGHLSQIGSDDTTATYSYGISGMRERKSVTTPTGTRVTESVWSGMQLLAERDFDGTTYEYVYGAGVPLELVVTPGPGLTGAGIAKRYAYQTDAGGSVIGITDASGAEIARYAYDPFGNPTATSGTDPVAARNPLRYRGYYYAAMARDELTSPRVPSTRRFQVVSIISDKLEAISTLCRKYGVVNMYLFGSAVGSDFEPGRSDVDLLVDFGQMDAYSKAHAYFDLLDELRRVLGTEVDLVMTGAVKNRYIAAEIERTKQMLYAA